MSNPILEFISTLFDPWDRSFGLNAWQMAARAVCIYLFAILIVRMGNKRFMGRSSAFDLLLGIMLGSVLSRAITGQAPLLGCMVAGAVLLLMHWILGALAFYIPTIGTLVKGRPRILIHDGQMDKMAMAKSHVGREDLAEALRAQAYDDDPARISSASLECSGDISLRLKNKMQVIEVEVAEGVQTVRVEFER